MSAARYRCGLVALVIALLFAAPAVATEVIHVTRHSWHTGIVVRGAAIPVGVLPETADFPRATHFEFGWGDAEYYPASEHTMGMTLRAALTPSPAVIHLVGLTAAPGGADESVTLTVTEEGFARLIAYLDAGFDRQGEPRTASLGPGLYGQSAFYPATGLFDINYTCNTWVAQGLKTAGVPLSSVDVRRAKPLMAALRKIAATKSD